MRTTRWEVLSHSWFAFSFALVGFFRPVAHGGTAPPSCCGTTRKATSLSVARHTATVVRHNWESRVTLGGTSHRHSCFRHNWESRITLGGESHRHSCRAQLGKLLLVAHVLDACCRAHVLDATQLPVSALLMPLHCRCIAAALPLHCRCTAATLLPLLPCCTHCRRHCHHLNHSHCAASSRSERMLPLFVLCCLPQFRWLRRQLCLAPLACSLASSSICHVAPLFACNC